VTLDDPARRGRRRVLWLGLGATGLLSVAAVAVVALDLFGATTPTSALAPPRFVDEASAAGIEHAYDGEWPFFLGGGVAVLDCDGDGLPDLYLAGGASPAALYRNESTVGGELRFARVPDQTTDLGEVTGAYPLDIDGDGIGDLAVLRAGENVLLRGLGDCRFERANEAWGFDGGDGWSTAFSATWEDPDSLPTLAVGDFLASTGLERTTCADNHLFRPEPGAARYAPPIGLGPGWCTQSMLFSDWDRSGRADLRVSNDRQYYRDGEEQLWRIVPGEAPRLYSREEGWKRLQIWGMGIASHDLTGDGRPEVFLTSQGDNKLQTLEEGATGPSYVDIAIRRGATVHRPYAGDVDLPSTAWHAEFQDVNNDGFIDLFVAKGNVEAMPDHAAEDPNNLLLGQPDGTFLEAAPEAGIVTFAKARGAALVDLNLDGMLDLVVVNRRENVELWRNVGWGDPGRPGPMGGWLAFRLQQPGANRDAIGSWVEIEVGDRTIRRELTVGGGHVGGQLGWVHLGIGPASRARIRVQWPDGELGPWMTVAAGDFVHLERGTSEPRPWVPPPED
jgi:enediyne biosynthesis protein E4